MHVCLDSTQLKVNICDMFKLPQLKMVLSMKVIRVVGWLGLGQN